MIEDWREDHVGAIALYKCGRSWIPFSNDKVFTDEKFLTARRVGCMRKSTKANVVAAKIQQDHWGENKVYVDTLLEPVVKQLSLTLFQNQP